MLQIPGLLIMKSFMLVILVITGSFFNSKLQAASDFTFGYSGECLHKKIFTENWLNRLSEQEFNKISDKMSYESRAMLLNLKHNGLCVELIRNDADQIFIEYSIPELSIKETLFTIPCIKTIEEIAWLAPKQTDLYRRSHGSLLPNVARYEPVSEKLFNDFRSIIESQKKIDIEIIIIVVALDNLRQKAKENDQRLDPIDLVEYYLYAYKIIGESEPDSDTTFFSGEFCYDSVSEHGEPEDVDGDNTALVLRQWPEGASVTLWQDDNSMAALDDKGIWSTADPGKAIKQTRILHYTFDSVPKDTPDATLVLEEPGLRAELLSVVGHLCYQHPRPKATDLVIRPVKHHSTGLKRMVVHRINNADGDVHLHFCFRDTFNRDTFYALSNLERPLNDCLSEIRSLLPKKLSYTAQRPPIEMIYKLNTMQEVLDTDSHLKNIPIQKRTLAQLIICHLKSVAKKNGLITNMIDQLLYLTLRDLCRPNDTV
jgi:hypothetical protein